MNEYLFLELMAVYTGEALLQPCGLVKEKDNRQVTQTGNTDR